MEMKKKILIPLFILAFILIFSGFSINHAKAQPDISYIFYDETQGVNYLSWYGMANTGTTDDTSDFYDGYACLELFNIDSPTTYVSAHSDFPQNTFSSTDDFNLSFYLKGTPPYTTSLTISITDDIGDGANVQVIPDGTWQHINLHKSDFSDYQGSLVWALADEITITLTNVVDEQETTLLIDNMTLQNYQASTTAEIQVMPPNNSDMGYADTSGTYYIPLGDTFITTAFANQGYYFNGWTVSNSSGIFTVTDNPLYQEAFSNTIITPNFSSIPFNSTYGSFGLNYSATIGYITYNVPNMYLAIYQFCGGNSPQFYATDINLLQANGYYTGGMNFTFCLYQVNNYNDNLTNLDLTLLGQTNFTAYYPSLSYNAIIDFNSPIPLVNGTYYAVGVYANEWCYSSSDTSTGVTLYFSDYDYLYNFPPITHISQDVYDIAPTNLELNFTTTYSYFTDNSPLFLHIDYQSLPPPQPTPINFPTDFIVFLIMVLVPTYIVYSKIGSIGVAPTVILMTIISWLGGMINLGILIIVVLGVGVVLFEKNRRK